MPPNYYSPDLLCKLILLPVRLRERRDSKLIVRSLVLQALERINASFKTSFIRSFLLLTDTWPATGSRSQPLLSDGSFLSSRIVVSSRSARNLDASLVLTRFRSLFDAQFLSR